MRNKIELWIGEERADLDNQSFLLLNYTMEELSNPTIVKNSFSQQITLKGTPQNNRIFGGIYRNDRSVDTSVTGETGPQFDPTRKTSFKIFNEFGELLEDGYLKLNKVLKTRKGVEYKITLYGSLGSFLYGISYDASGNKLTLADLDFGETLDFTINRTAVSDAWTRILHGTGDAKWDIINFVPGYNGLPASPFDANKCYVLPWMVGLKDREGDYRANSTIVTLNEKVTGDMARDYRSYLQKPAIKMSAVINAICDPSNNGGWTVNKDASFFSNGNPYWTDAWMTLPSLYDLNINDSETSNTQTMTSLNTKLPIVGGGGAGVYKVTVNANVGANMMGLPNFNYKLWCANSWGNSVNMFKVTVRLYDSSQNEIAVASYRITTDGAPWTSTMPAPDFTFDHIDGSGFFCDSNGNPVTFPLYIEAIGASFYQVEMDCENYWQGSPAHYPGELNWEMWDENETVFANGFTFDPLFTTTNVDIVSSSSSTVRTGATITKAALLGGGHTPAEYLLSYCKMFGIQLVCHKGEKVIDLIARNNFYSGTVVDINNRIDRGREMEKTPFAFDARWYLFGNETKGEFAEYYKSRYNRPFGQYRVNTGYEFDAEEKEMTKDIVFNNVCSLMEASPYFCYLDKDGKNIPPVFLAGGKYLLYNGSETLSVDLPYYSEAAKTWYNPSYPMHDVWDRPQFHGTQNAHIDERDTLVFFNFLQDTSAMHLTLSDDIERVLLLNGNNPCWMPDYCDVDPDWKIDEMPFFSRYVWSGTTINYQLDWGDPSEMQIPGAQMGVVSNIFDQYWGKYIADRYDDDSAVVTCYVDWRGKQVGIDLFKDFYWFDGCVWALNRIINYSLTTSGPVQCEFVKVQDKNNYTSL